MKTTYLARDKKGRLRMERGDVVWREHEKQLRAFFMHKDGREEMATWCAQSGSQEAFIDCRHHIFECLYEGERGPGKTDALLMDFARETGRGFGSLWNGLLLRRTYRELEDVIKKTLQWFPQIWPEAQYNGSRHFWRWPGGETLWLQQFYKVDDYWKFHGHEYPWQGWEELTNWPDPDGFLKMQSLCRCAGNSDVPMRIRATCNPYGVGHSWVKERYRLPLKKGHTIGPIIDDDVDEEGEPLPARVAIHGHLHENKILLHADPKYTQKLRQAASSEAEYHAWVHGNWDIVAGGMFHDVWKPDFNIVQSFQVPRSWKIDRSFDWGSARPFSVGWWAESDGTDVTMGDGTTRSTVRGDLFRIGEWYGWNGKANKGCDMLPKDIAAGIVERELAMGIRARVRPGPADTSIFTAEAGPSIATEMMKPVRINGKPYRGVTWTRADKKSGSRVAGWQKMRQMLKAAWWTGKPRETPGLFVTEQCTQFIRTIPILTRDVKKMDDVDTDMEDHIADETRYRVRFCGRGGRGGKAIGTGY